LKQGVGLSVFSSCLFASLYYFATVLEPLDGLSVFAWRVVLALPVLALLISRAREWKTIRQILRRLSSEWQLLAALVGSGSLLGVQLLLFMWAPLHGYGLDVSMGYFLLPLAMVVVGRVFYGERLTWFQQIAVLLAVLGVGHELMRVGTFSWATALVIVGYPPYFMLRRYLHMKSLVGLWFDMVLLAPIAVAVLCTQEVSVAQQFGARPLLWVLVPMLGAVSCTALVCYLAASRRLPLGLFGILGYVEPVLLFWVAVLLLNEPVRADAWWTYIPIWSAVLLMCAEGLFAWRREKKGP
jgi:rarD protein